MAKKAHTNPPEATPAKEGGPALGIITLRISHFGIIKAAAINPDGSPVVIAGDNGNGKSTVLNAIETVLRARRLADPVTHGEQKSQIKLELGEAVSGKAIYRIEQIIKNDEDGTPCYNLKVFNADDDSQVPSPAKFIEDLIGSGAAIDPTEIMQPKPGERPETFAKRQAEILMERLGLTGKAKDLDEKIAEKTEQRKKATGDAEALQARLKALEVPADTPNAPIDVAELSKRMSELNNLKTQRDRLAFKLDEKKTSVTNSEATIARLEKELIAAREAMEGAEKLFTASVAELEDFDEENPQEGIEKALADIMGKMTNANSINAAVQKKQDRNELSKQATEAEARTGTLTSELEKLRKERLDLVRAAKLPVEGLELTAEALLFHGNPLVQESTGNMIRVCAQLAMAEEPRCRVIFLREGSLTNRANRQIIYEVARERKFQVWEERFSEAPVDGALWISGGEVTTP